MSHIDEGELHAWLDGALEQLGDGRAAEVREHLRVCAACREALVAEERVRARAAEVLAFAAPRAAEAPPFETLVERARVREAAPSRRRMTRYARMGWAASVVVALGAGWMARELGLHPPAEPVALEREQAASADAPARAEEADAVVAAAPAPEYATGNSSSAVAPGSPARIAAESGAGADMVAQGSGAERLPVLADTRFDAQLQGPAQRETRMEAMARADVRAPAPVAPVSAPAPPPSAPAEVRGAVGGAAEAQRRESASLAGRSGSRALAATAASGVGLQQPARADSVPGVPRIFAERAEAGAVSGVADVDEALDLIVPGLEVLHVEWSQLEPGQPMRRVLQRLANGDTLDIRFVRSLPANAVADPLARLLSAEPLPGWSQVKKVHRDGWLVARAPLAQAELEALVERAGTR